MSTSDLDLHARYTVRDWSGIAVRIVGYPQQWDEDSEEWEDDVDSGQVIVIMVGDDHKHTVDVDDLKPLGEHDYCHECGQVGCCHDGIDRSEDDD